MDGSNNDKWLWPVVVVLAALALGVAYYYYSYNYVPYDTTGENVPTEEEFASELGSLKLDNLDSELRDIEKEFAQ
jgi:hypothetical protein